MDQQNRFVIISPSYNNAQWVETYYQSITTQTYDNYQVLYINDKSTDNTGELIESFTKDNPRFKVIHHTENKGAAYNYVEYLDSLDLSPEDILVHLDGDDWLAYPTTLEYLNNYYNQKDVWMTYGKFVTYPDLKEGNPQNSPYPDFVKKHKLYRKDVWRASHLRTYKYFLFDNIDKEDLKSRYTQEYFWHASDLAWAYPCLEMCPADKIGVVEEFTYVYNVSEADRTKEREAQDNTKFEVEIRNKKHYKTLEDKSAKAEKLPQVNAFGDYRERHFIPETFSYVYNLTEGEYDVTILQDDSILEYLAGRIKVDNSKPVVAIVAEGPHLFNQQQVYSNVINNYDKFAKVLGWHESLFTLPNFQFRPLTEISQWNLLPEELNISDFRIYNKTKVASFIASNKNLCAGHQFRLNCVNEVRKTNLNVDLYGRGINPISSKIEGLKDYCFSVAIENETFPHYFTEKILDCFLSGTIPIYYGCTNIEEYFNPEGVISFSSESELVDILSGLSTEMYQQKFHAVEENLTKALELWENNDIFYFKYLKNLI